MMLDAPDTPALENNLRFVKVFIIYFLNAQIHNF